jgi:hypothetical protein
MTEDHESMTSDELLALGIEKIQRGLQMLSEIMARESDRREEVTPST